MNKFISILLATLAISFANGQNGPAGALSTVECTVWYKANSLSSADGSIIQTWDNQGGNLTNAIQNTANRRPQYKDVTGANLNGLPVLRFDGNNDYFVIADHPSLNIGENSQRTIQTVIRTGADINTRQTVFEEGGSTRGLNIYIFNGELYLAAWNDANDGPGAPWSFKFIKTTISANTPYILTYVFDGNNTTTGSITGYIDGIQFGTVTGVGLLYEHSDNIGLGAKNSNTEYETGNSGGTGNYFEGDIAEFIHYNTVLNSTRLNLQWNYLSSKYDLTLGSFDSNDMDTPANGNYDFELAGISQTTATNNNTDAQGSSIFRVNGSDNLDDTEWLLWAHDGASISETTSGIPAGTTYKLGRTWRAKEGNGEVGSHDVLVDVNNISVSGNIAADFFLLIDPVDDDFSDVTPIAATSYASGIITFNNINLNNGDRFTLACNETPIGSIGPAGVGDNTENRFWYDANDLIDIDSDNDIIQTWTNKGGASGENAFQNTSNRRPTFNSDASKTMNNYPVLTFDGSNDYLDISNTNELNLGAAQSERSFFTAFRTGSDISTRQMIYEEGGTIRGLNFYIFNNEIYAAGWNLANDGAGSPWAFNSVKTGINTNTTYFLSYIYNGNSSTTGSITFYLNGQLVGTINNIGLLYAHSGGINIGASDGSKNETANMSGTNTYFNGDIAEFIQYNYAVNSTQRIIVENYLSAKYDINPNTNNEYSMDDNGNGDYDHEMAGIGQISGGDNHTDAKGPGEVRIYNPTNVGNGEYLTWAHNDESFCNSDNVPPGTAYRTERVWRVSENGEIGNHDLLFEFDDVSFPNSGNISLLIDTDNDGDFSNATLINQTTNSNNIVTFSDVNLSNGNYFTFASTDQFTDNSLKTTIWNGGSTDFTDASNWSNGLPSLGINAVIPSGLSIYPILTSTTTSGSLEIQNGASLEVSGINEIRLFGDFTIDGTFICNQSTITMAEGCGMGTINCSIETSFYNLVIDNNKGLQNTGTNINILNSFQLQQGDFNTGNEITFISDANGTARISEITGGAISGNIKTQRFIDAGETNWRLLTFPVSGADLEQFDDDFLSSGIPGSDYPNWPTAADPFESFMFYDESLGTNYDDGFLIPNSTSDIVNPGQGVWIWCGDTITGTDPFTIDAAGPANQGDINLPVTFNASSGNMANDGWNLVANPYMCTIDWESAEWTKTNIEDAIYIWNPDNQQYATYVSGVGTNLGSQFIASSQAFWVHADAANPVLTATEKVKVNQDQGFIKAAISQDLLRIRIEENGALADEMVVRFDNNATDGFDKFADGRKFEAHFVSSPAIHSSYNGLDYSVNTLTEPTGLIQIPVTTKVPTSGIYTISVTENDAILSYGCVVIEDLVTGTVLDLKTLPTYSFYANATSTSARFMIKIVNGFNSSSSNLSCSGDSNGEIEATLNGVNSFDLNKNGSLVTTQNTNNGNVLFNNLSAGVYVISTSNYINSCPTITDTVEIIEPTSINVSETITNESCVGCCDGEIDLNISGGTPNYNTVVTDVNGSLFTTNNLCEGSYIVSTTDANGCEIINQYIIEGAEVNSIEENEIITKIYPNPASNFVRLEFTKNIESISLYDQLGKEVLKINNPQVTEEINLLQLSKGVYYIKIKDGDLNITKKLIVK